MIRLSGRANRKSKSAIIGMRPGEKLFEELVTEGENMLPTYHEKIRIFRGPRKESALSWSAG